MTEKLDTWTVHYNFDGSAWAMDVKAKDGKEAMERLQRAAAFGRLSGRQVLSIPIAPSWLVSLVLRLWHGRS